MAQLVVLNLGSGSYKTGFQTVTVQLWNDENALPVKFSGSLPPAPELLELYRRWRALYEALYARLNWRRSREIEPPIEPPMPGLPVSEQNQAEPEFTGYGNRQLGGEVGKNFGIEFEQDDGLNHVSQAAFEQVCQQLGQQLNQWLQSAEFAQVDQRLRMRLDSRQDIKVIVETDDLELRRLPWHLWNLVEHFPQGEVALSPQSYERVERKAEAKARDRIRILAILGHSEGINLQQDCQVLEQLPQAEVVFLSEPSRVELDRWLWDTQGWDILFFAGHSISIGNHSQAQGKLYLNPRESLSLEQLRNALRAAIQHGLALAIFNSCDGLGLARTLGDLNIPQLIVMGEPVPDQVAQTFLRHFLQALAAGMAFYPAVRQAREQLQALEDEFPCASWLPRICQNPAVESLTWPLSLPVSDAEKSAPAVPGGLESDASTVTAVSTVTGAAEVTDTIAPGEASNLSLLSSSMGKAKGQRLPRWKQWTLALVTSCAAWGLAVGLQQTGLLRAPELWSYDQLIRQLSDEDPDPRLLIVEVTERDLREYGWPLSDAILVRLFTQLNQANPHGIGLDIFRDLPQEPGHSALRQYWQDTDNTVAICLHSQIDLPGVPSPVGLPEQQVGFNDVPLDRHDVVRRQLWAMAPPTRSDCQTQLSFSLVLSRLYLQAEGIESSQNADGSIQLGDLRIPPLPAHTQGYPSSELRGYQTLLRYRRHRGSVANFAQRVSLAEVLNGQVSPALIEQRIVLVGITASSIQDGFQTPYGEPVRGVMLHGQMVSQILSAVVDGRSLIAILPLWKTCLWVGVWAFGGGITLLYVNPRERAVPMTLGLGLCFLVGISAVSLWQGLWLPLMPAGLAWLGASCGSRWSQSMEQAEK